MNYRIGLDIGIGSVGWSIIENDPITEAPIRIVNLGVRTFSPNEVDKTGESTAKARREARGVHRRNRRRAFRVKRIKSLIEQKLNVQEKDLLSLINEDVYKLRTKALDAKLENKELAKVILHILKYRGFKSNRKALASSSDEGNLLKSINKNAEFLKEHSYRTIGEAIYKDSRFKTGEFYAVRNHNGDYKNCFYRADIAKELLLILETQMKLNSAIDKPFIDRVMQIFESQRNFDEGPGAPSPYSAKFAVGECTFLKGEIRAPKASLTFEYFTGLSKINNLKIGDDKLSAEQRAILIEYIKTHDSLTFERVRKLLNVENSKTFNLCRYGQLKLSKDVELSQEELNALEEELFKKSERATFITMKHGHSIKKALGVDSIFDNKDMINEIALMLSLTKSDARIDEYINNNEKLKTLTEEQRTAVKALNFDKFGALSIKAMEKIIPHLEQGLRYDQACKEAGFNHSSFEHEKFIYLRGPEIAKEFEDITSNVVKRAVNQAIRIVNEIISKYGSPQFVTIELSRELSKNRADRKALEKQQEKNESENRRAMEILQSEEYKNDNPSRLDVLIYRLYNEQCCKCMYSGHKIEAHRLFEPNYLQIDHILPYSKSMDDSYNNKVLVIADENQNKGNRTPYEFFGSDEKRWSEFVSRAKLIRNRVKQRNLLKEHITQEEQAAFIERNLNDTKYMSKFLFNLFQKYLMLTPSTRYVKQIRCINGAVTSYLRKCWGINKIREDGDTHHAVDACIIAVAEERQIQKITNFNKFKELFKKDKRDDGDVFIHRVTGEVMTEQEKREYEDQKVSNELATKLPLPYPEFRKELVLRSRTNYRLMKFTEQEQADLRSIGYEYDEIAKVRPIFVSRMKTVKKTGAIHKETIMSTREYATSKMLIKRVPLTSLKIENKPEAVSLKDDKYPECRIANYYRPQDDRLLYLKLKNYLMEEGYTLPDKFYKPKKDGSDGPVVRTAKVYEKVSNPVITPNGGAANDKMYRIDVFEKGGKYFVCPVYISDVYAKKLPNKLVVQGKPWLELDNTYNFKFSLYQNDLIRVKAKRSIKFKKCNKNENSTKPEEIELSDALVYYNGFNIAVASIELFTHDRNYSQAGCGVKTLPLIEKYNVDIMGNIYKAPQEERKSL